MELVLITIAFVGLFFILMSVRIIFKKKGEFKGTCASQSPFLNKEGATCGYCGRKVGEEPCGNPDADKNEVDKVMSKFN